MLPYTYISHLYIQQFFCLLSPTFRHARSDVHTVGRTDIRYKQKMTESEVHNPLFGGEAPTLAFHTYGLFLNTYLPTAAP
jgi:hypothetical protein